MSYFKETLNSFEKNGFIFIWEKVRLEKFIKQNNKKMNSMQ
jgi:hypothetical protein